MNNEPLDRLVRGEALMRLHGVAYEHLHADYGQTPSGRAWVRLTLLEAVAPGVAAEVRLVPVEPPPP